MRILTVNYEYPPIGGGGGLVTRDILEQIVEYGHSVSIITSHFEGLERHEVVNGVEIFRVPVLFRNKVEVANLSSMLSYFPSSVLHALSSVKGRRYNIINTHFAVPSGPTGYLLSKLFDLPNALTIHGSDIFDPSKSLSPHKTPGLRNIVQFMINNADRVIAQSNDTRTNAYRYFHVKRHIDIIALGIKKPTFVKKTREDFNINPKDVVFCTIGRLIKRKNLDDVLKILSRIKDSLRFTLLIIGDGPERPHLKTLVRRLVLDGRVRLVGNVSDEVKFQLLDLSDCFISTSLHEGFGLVFLEAMECGLPIICYDQGGQNDFLLDGKTGFLVQLGDKDSFGEKIADLLNNSKLKMDMAFHNRRYVQDYYISNCAKQYISLFRKVISEHRLRKRAQKSRKRVLRRCDEVQTQSEVKEERVDIRRRGFLDNRDRAGAK